MAVDGKALRSTRHSADDGQAARLLAAIGQQARTVLAQTAVDGKASEVTRFAPLLWLLDLASCVSAADALHTQREHAKHLVTGQHADYILSQEQPVFAWSRTGPQRGPDRRPRPDQDRDCRARHRRADRPAPQGRHPALSH
jgi:hypothetical protein